MSGVKNIDSVFVGLIHSELELSLLCNDDIQCDSLFGQYVGESVQLRYMFSVVVSVGVEGYVRKFFE